MTETTRATIWGGQHGRPGWGRRLAFVALAVVLAAVALVLAGLASINNSIDRVGVEGLGQGPHAGGAPDDTERDPWGDEDLDPRALTVLVLGSDSREVLTPEERRELGTGDAEGERTEVISLARLDPDDGEVRLLSIPRDTLITRCDGSSGRINAAYGIGEVDGRGGATCVVQTLKDWLGVRIDHVVKVDFRGFVDIVDSLGGVSMYLDEPLQDDDAHLDLDAGCVQLDGADALAFVRARHIDDDFGRMGRQQRFISELRDELAGVGTFDDPTRAYRVAEAVARAVELDDSLTLNRIQQLVREHRGTIQGGIDGQVVPGALETIDGAAYVRADEDRAEELLRWLMTGDDPADRSTTSEELAADDAASDDDPATASTTRTAATAPPAGDDESDAATPGPDPSPTDGAATTTEGSERCR